MYHWGYTYTAKRATSLDMYNENGLTTVLLVLSLSLATNADVATLYEHSNYEGNQTNSPLYKVNEKIIYKL